MRHLDAAAVAQALDRVALIDALAEAFRSGGDVPLRQHHGLPGGAGGPGSLLVMPAWRAGGAIGVKLVTVFAGNSAQGLGAVHASYTLFAGDTGVPLATLDGEELTLRRTGAASALAARYLAREDTARLLLVGAGRLGSHLIESHAAVRTIREVRIWARRPERAALLARQLQDRPYTVTVASDLESAVAWADLISCATLAREPLIRGEWLQPGQHLDLVGAFNPEMREADDAAIARASVCVDTRSGALRESGELVQALARGVITLDHIRGELADLTRGDVAGRARADEITLFKSVGTALEDLAAAELAIAGAGHPP